MRAQSEFTASIGVFVAASLWGLYWIPIRYLEDKGLDGSWTIAVINAPGALALLAALVFWFGPAQLKSRPAISIGFMTGLGLALYATSIVHTDVVRATLLFYLMPIWATLIGFFWLGETPNWQRWGAIALGLAGLALLVSGNSGRAANVGDLAALISGIAWAIGAAQIRHHGKIPIVGAMFYQFTFLCIIAIGAGYLLGAPELPGPNVVAELLWIVLLITLGLILPAILIIFWAQQFMSPGRVGLLMMSEVIVAMISAALILPDERLAAIQWIGAAFIIAASIVELIPTRRRPRDHG